MDKRSKKQNIAMLLELERLIETNGDPKRIKHLREILGLKERAEPVKDFPEETFWTLKAMRFNNREIAFILKLGVARIKQYTSIFTDKEIAEKIEWYSRFYVVDNYLTKRGVKQ